MSFIMPLGKGQLMQFQGYDFFYDPNESCIYPITHTLPGTSQIVPTSKIRIAETGAAFMPALPFDAVLVAETVDLVEINDLRPGAYAVMYRLKITTLRPFFVLGFLRSNTQRNIEIKPNSPDYWEFVIEKNKIDCLFRVTHYLSPSGKIPFQ